MTYLICNAHLDPVWLWRWDEGAGEALSTFRTAVDLLDEYPEFIFNHNESLLYEWIEEYDPKLFERIKTLVKAGRWEIIGGWFLQPDCNIPKGESIVRQILRGQRYFESRFGKIPITANNFDTFGHSRGLATILNQCGYKHYIICRPKKEEALGYGFDSPDFVWKGYDSSDVIVHRSDEFYNSVLGKADEKITAWHKVHGDSEDTLLLWGVGNHGGGASRKDLENIADLIKKGVKIKHAVPSEYFDKLDKAALPVMEQGLNRINEGCYTSHIRVKQQHRRLENDLLMTEIMASHAAINQLSNYEYELIADAWRDLLFAEFHDSLPGSAIQLVEEDTLRVLDHGLNITNKLKAKYFFALSSGQEKLKPDTVPLLVYNPHPFAVRTTMECSLLLPAQGWTSDFHVPVVSQNGKRLPSQLTKEESNFPLDWCKRVVFAAGLSPISMNRYDVSFELCPARPVPPPPVKGADITVKTVRGSVTVNGKTGLADSYVIDGKEYLQKNAFSFDVFEDGFDSWRGNFWAKEGFKKAVDSFKLMEDKRATAFAGVKGMIIEPVRIIEDGEVRTVIEALFEYGDSRLCLRYLVNKLTGVLELAVIVFFGENEKRIKLSVPTTLTKSDYFGQTMFGSEKLNLSSGENVAHQWTAVCDGEYAFTIANDGVYGSDYEAGIARLSLLRSAGYSARDPDAYVKHYGPGSGTPMGEPFHEPMYNPRMEQGERRYRFILMGGKQEERLAAVDQEAAILNMQPYVLPYCPSGEGEKPLPLIVIDKSNVILSCFKRDEDNIGAYIVRVYESQGMQTSFVLEIPALEIVHADKLKTFEIKTYRVNSKGIFITNMLEQI
jgi:alpha-mannosidase